MTKQLPIQDAEARAVALKDLLQYAEAGIVSRTVLATPTLRVVLFAFAKGQELTEHASGRRALVQVLEGGCEFKFNGAWQTLGEGALLHMPPGHPHAVKAAAGPCALLLTLHGGDAAGSTESASEANA